MGGPNSLKRFNRLTISLICTFAFSFSFTATAYADDCSSAGFKAAANITLDTAPFAIAAADFNGDGHLDLVYVPNDSSQQVLVLYGRGGTEKFGPPSNVPVGGDARTVAVGDLNGDSKPDLVFSLDIAFAQPSARLSVLLNDGTGKFGAPNIFSLQGNASQIVLADLNNDSKLDIVAPLFAFTFNGQVAIFLGNGSGGFSQAANSPISTFSRNVAAIVVGDFNEDGKRDLALDQNTRVSVFLANLQLAPGDGASSVIVDLFDTNGLSHDVPAEDMRAVPFSNFIQISFRLPDNLRAGVCVVKVKGPHNQESNAGTLRISN